MKLKPTAKLNDSILFDPGRIAKLSIDPIWQSTFSKWKPFNQVNHRIEIQGRAATILFVWPPVYMDEVERIYVKFDDNQMEELFPIRGIRIGEDWIK